MAKTAVVIGATGGQGGSVARALLKTGDWKVRGITRNVASKSAQALAAQGAVVVAANIDDEESLVQAFEGAHAIFAVTNFWETLGAQTADEASRAEQKQAFKIASAASKTPTLEHYVWSTLPSTKTVSGGKHFVPHMEPKAQVDDYIRTTYPELAKKSTFLWVSWYPQNLAYFPLLRFFELPTSGKYVWMQPSAPNALLPTAGDISVNIGVYVSAILAKPHVSLPARYAWVQTEKPSMLDITATWSKITGKPAEYVEVSMETFVKLWGPAGQEMALQLKFGEDHGDWATFGVDLLTEKELGIGKGDLVGLEGCLEKLKGALL